MTRLGVNVDHIATLRQARRAAYPDPLEAAHLAAASGADQITIHLREDRRHIQDRDVLRMRREIAVPLNLEMAAADPIVTIACEVRPATATLVPERREELTTEGGLDAAADVGRLTLVAARLGDADIAVSLFIDPEERQLEAAVRIQAHTIELHTGAYCGAASEEDRRRELKRLARAAQQAKSLGFKVCAGHGINYENAATLSRALPEVEEYNIGHAIVARACLVGMAQAVREMKTLLTALPSATSSS